MASLTIHLDWLRYTMHYSDEPDLQKAIARARPATLPFTWAGKEYDAAQGYNRGRDMLTGKVFWHTLRPEQGIGVQLTGENLNHYRAQGYDEHELLCFVERINGAVSTLHACINLHDTAANVQDVLDADAAGTLIARAKHRGEQGSKDKVNGQWIHGKTAYIGSPKSAIQVRIYNKAAERRIISEWVRIEIIFRGRYARAAHTAMVKHGIAPVTRSAIAKQCSVPYPWWDYAMSGETSAPVVVPRKERGTYAWLKRVVLPALENAIDAQRAEGRDDIYQAYSMLIERKRPGPAKAGQ